MYKPIYAPSGHLLFHYDHARQLVRVKVPGHAPVIVDLTEHQHAPPTKPADAHPPAAEPHDAAPQG